jgi:hypothetical protein
MLLLKQKKKKKKPKSQKLTMALWLRTKLPPPD